MGYWPLTWTPTALPRLIRWQRVSLFSFEASIFLIPKKHHSLNKEVLGHWHWNLANSEISSVCQTCQNNAQRGNIPNSKKTLSQKVSNVPKNCEKCDPKRDKKIPQIDIFIQAGMHLCGFTPSETLRKWKHFLFYWMRVQKVICIRRPHTTSYHFLVISHPSWIGYKA